MVDDINAEMLVNEFGIPRERVRVIYNAVDMARLPTRRRALPAKLERALIFVKDNAPYLETARAACARRNIATELIGYPIGRPHPNPLELIVESDLVIGAARTAIEGAVGGAAVLVADHRGLAALLTTSNLEQFRANNFGRELLTRPLDIETIGAEIDGYDAADATAVSQFMREAASLDLHIERLNSVLLEALDRFRLPDAEAYRQALSRYLALHLPRADEASPRHDRSSSGWAMNARLTTDVQLTTMDERLTTMDERLTTMDERLTVIEAMLQRNNSLIRMLRPMAVALRKLAGVMRV